MPYPTRKQWMWIAGGYTVGTLVLTGLGKGVWKCLLSIGATSSYIFRDKYGNVVASGTTTESLGRLLLRIMSSIDVVAFGIALGVLLALILVALRQFRIRWSMWTLTLLVSLSILGYYTTQHMRPAVRTIESGTMETPQTGLFAKDEGPVVCSVRATFAQRLRSLCPGRTGDLARGELAYFAAEHFVRDRLAAGVVVHDLGFGTGWNLPIGLSNMGDFYFWRDQLMDARNSYGVKRTNDHFIVTIMLSPKKYALEPYPITVRHTTGSRFELTAINAPRRDM